MEGKAIELTPEELEIMDEMCFSVHFSELSVILSDEELTFKCLLNLFENQLIQGYYPTPDLEVQFDLQSFKEFYKDYYYLATKRGLKVLFG